MCLCDRKLQIFFFHVFLPTLSVNIYKATHFKAAAGYGSPLVKPCPSLLRMCCWREHSLGLHSFLSQVERTGIRAWADDKCFLLTRMHSSGMCTAHLLPVSPSMHCSGEVYLPQRVPARGRGVPGGCTCWGVYLSGGCTCPGEGVYLHKLRLRAVITLSLILTQHKRLGWFPNAIDENAFCRSYYRSGTVNSKSFVGIFLLRIKWKFELN